MRKGMIPAAKNKNIPARVKRVSLSMIPLQSKITPKNAKMGGIM